MKKSGLGLLLILVMALLISAVLADPQIGDPPFYKYPFLCDYDFNVPDNSYLALGPGESNPPRGTTYSDGKWYSAHLGTLSPESYARVENGMAKLKTVTIHWNPGVFGGTIVDQGRASHLAVQLGHFKGSNTTYSDANPTSRIIFNYGETIPSGTLWLDVRARILDRADMNYENMAPAANLGFNFQFQPEYRDALGNVVLEDYDNPDFWAGGRTFPNVVHFDIFLSKHSWWPGGFDKGEEAVGWRFRHINAPSDADLHVQRVEGQMWNLNTWYNFHIDLGYCINDALQMTEDHYYSLYGDPYPPHGYFTLNRLILRNIQLYTEASGALIEAEVDKAYIYTNYPPVVPSEPSGARYGLTSGNYPYSTVTTDPEGDGIIYEFSWGDGTTTTVGWYASGVTATASHRWPNPGTYEVKVRAKDSKGAWSEWSPTFTVMMCQPTGGCPYVSVWDGNQYVLDNNVLPAAEVSNGTDVEDYYRLEQTLVPTWQGRLYSLYSLKLSEFEQEHSYINQVRLLAVDHNSDVNIAVTPDGEILTYRNPWAPISALDNYGNNRLNEISQMDGNISDPQTYYYGEPNDYLVLNFGLINSDNAKLILRDDIIKKDECIEVQVKDNDGIWQIVDTVLPRAYWSIEGVNLSPYIVDGQDFWVRLYWKNPHRLDYVGLDTTAQEDYEVSTATLVSAVHSTEGNMKPQLLANDNVYAELIPEQQILLAFKLPNNTNQARAFIFYTEGHYYTIE